jgi:hypothetical protein
MEPGVKNCLRALIIGNQAYFISQQDENPVFLVLTPMINIGRQVGMKLESIINQQELKRRTGNNSFSNIQQFQAKYGRKTIKLGEILLKSNVEL